MVIGNVLLGRMAAIVDHDQFDPSISVLSAIAVEGREETLVLPAPDQEGWLFSR